MKNITLSVDEDVLEAVRRYAVANRTSVNAIVRDELHRLAQSHGRLEEAMKELRALSARSPGLLGTEKWTRVELQDR
jgi:hypothetical protein